MVNARTVASLYARRRRLILGLQDFERRAEVYRSAVAELEAKLQTLVPFVPPFNPRKSSQYFTSREFIRGYYDAVREADGGILTPNEIAIFLMRRKGLDISDTALQKTIRRRVLGTLRRIKRRDADT
jgi:hypothetical protein